MYKRQGHDGDDFPPRVQVVHDRPTALEMEAVQDRLDGEQKDVGGQEADHGSHLLLVLLDAGHDAAAFAGKRSL